MKIPELGLQGITTSSILLKAVTLDYVAPPRLIPTTNYEVQRKTVVWKGRDWTLGGGII